MATIQIKTIMAATAYFILESMGSVLAFCRHSSMISFGIILKTTEIPAGTIIKSSNCPNTGMKSGIKSIGVTA